MITGVHLITGLIGSGKTLRAVWYIDQEVKAGRPVYVCNLTGLNVPGAIPHDNPRDWRDLPPGALLVVDEAQRYWRARRSGEVPEELQDMETSRHDGVSLLVITQQPTYLDKHLRGLVTTHEHVYRRGGLKTVEVFSWERCVDDPLGSDRSTASSTMFTYPKHLFSAYKSAEVHTVKPKLPMKMKLAIAAIALALISGGSVYFDVSGGTAHAQGDKRAQQAVPSPVSAPHGAATGEGRPLTRLEYKRDWEPRIQGALWSAPVFDEVNEVQEPPEVYCMIGDTCHCISEQGIRVEVAEKACRDIVLNGGLFNPYKKRQQQPVQQQPPGGGGAAPTQQASPAAAPVVVGTGDPGELQAAYGAMRGSTGTSAP